MFTLHPKSRGVIDDLREVDHEPSPTTEPHASPEDRALGIELELIELTRRREELEGFHSAERFEIDAKLRDAFDELADAADEVAQRHPAA